MVMVAVKDLYTLHLQTQVNCSKLCCGLGLVGFFLSNFFTFFLWLDANLGLVSLFALKRFTINCKKEKTLKKA